MGKIALACVLGIFAVSAQGQITTKDLSELTAQQLGDILAGAGIQISNVTYTGANIAAGSFTGGSGAGLGIESGVILSSGNVADVAGPNDSTGKTTTLGTPGDADLNGLIAPRTTLDATILEFDFVAQSENFAIRYVFGSEEYKEWVNSNFNDVFGFFLDGVNIAFVAGSSSQLVSVNSINHQVNTQFYIDNPTLEGQFDTQLDGFTTVLIATAIVTPGVQHHIKLAIADATDTALDSVVVLAEGGITGAPLLRLIPDPYQSFAEIGEDVEFKVHAFAFAPDARYTLSATNLPFGSSVRFEPTSLKLGEAQSATVTVDLPPNIFPRDYIVEMVAVPDKAQVETAHGAALITVGCTPPMILALDQPRSVTVASGSTASLSVKAQGSGPLLYQWYEGPKGSIYHPVAGATSATFTTPAIDRARAWWVRVENGCGTVDSAAAKVSLTGSHSRRPVGRTE